MSALACVPETDPEQGTGERHHPRNSNSHRDQRNQNPNIAQHETSLYR